MVIWSLFFPIISVCSNCTATFTLLWAGWKNSYLQNGNFRRWKQWTCRLIFLFLHVTFITFFLKLQYSILLIILHDFFFIQDWLKETDQTDFNLDVTALVWLEYFDKLAVGSRVYLSKDPLKTLKAAKRKHNM